MYSLIVSFIDVQPYTHNIDYHICNMRYSKKVQTAVQKRYHRKEARAATTTTSISARSSILSREIFSTCEQKGTAMADRRNQNTSWQIGYLLGNNKIKRNSEKNSNLEPIMTTYLLVFLLIINY